MQSAYHQREEPSPIATIDMWKQPINNNKNLPVYSVKYKYKMITTNADRIYLSPIVFPAMKVRFLYFFHLAFYLDININYKVYLKYFFGNIYSSQ